MPPRADTLLTVAVTGPTGEIGASVVDALERDERVGRVLGMARRPFDPASRGWAKTEYRQGDMLDRGAVDSLVADADVVVHLAYLIMGSREESRRTNLAGTRTVFEATVAAPRPSRLVYTSSVAAYGYHSDNPVPLTEDVPARGSAEHYYSEQKAECEALLHEVCDATDLAVYVLRPCIVSGPGAPALARYMPWQQVTDALPSALRGLVGAVPGPKGVIPDPGTPVQLVHHDDVASAVALAVTSEAPAGDYNIAGDGTVTMSDIAKAVGALSVRVPQVTATVASRVLATLPWVPAAAEWIHIFRAPVTMDTAKAKSELGWAPQHTAQETLDGMAAAL